MVKKHNSTDRILVFMLNNRTEAHTIHAISKKTGVDYKTAHTMMKDLADRGIVQAKKIGQTIVCRLHKGFDEDVYRAEIIRKEKMLKNPDLKGIYRYVNESKANLFILLLFGSWASGKNTKNSDIDLLLITDDEKTKQKIKNQLKLLPFDIHLVDHTSEEFLSMMNTTQLTVGKEAADNNIILFGIEDYYRMLQNAQ